MILDAALLLSGAVAASGTLTGQAIAGAGSFVSSNTMDAAPLNLGGNQSPDLGSGEELNAVFSVLSAPTAGTSVQFQVIQADDAALTANVEVISTTDAIPVAQLPTGKIVKLMINPAPGAAKRYIGARYNTVGAIANMSVSASITKDVQGKGTAFKSGFTVA